MHVYSHNQKLNLRTIDACENINAVAKFFTSTCLSFHSHLSSYYNELQKEIGSQITKLNKLSDTYCLWNVAVMLSY